VFREAYEGSSCLVKIKACAKFGNYNCGVGHV
jgi:hypothetical protein